jgi:hypothetical protein
MGSKGCAVTSRVTSPSPSYNCIAMSLLLLLFVRLELGFQPFTHLFVGVALTIQVGTLHSNAVAKKVAHQGRKDFQALLCIKNKFAIGFLRLCCRVSTVSTVVAKTLNLKIVHVPHLAHLAYNSAQLVRELVGTTNVETPTDGDIIRASGVPSGNNHHNSNCH